MRATPSARATWTGTASRTRWTAAQAIANQWKITKEECQDFAVASHEKALKATKEGYFKKEILPSRALDKDGNAFLCDTDEPVRAGVTREVLDALKVLPGTDWMTAGLSSTVTDGASAVVLMSGEKVKELGLTPLARVVANAVVGSDPKLMLTGPMTVTPKVLARGGSENEGHRHLRGQRGLRADTAGLGKGDQGRHDEAQRQRRRHGAGTPGRQQRVPAHVSRRSTSCSGGRRNTPW